jgi:hypothetical protein
LDVRHNNPLQNRSAFIFENSYGEIRNSFCPGTPSTLKQMFQTIILKRKLAFHSCQLPIHYNLVYVFVNNTYKFYQIKKTIPRSKFFMCNPLGSFPYVSEEIPDIPWNKIGVFKKGALGNTCQNIHESLIAGKALLVQNYLITCPNTILREQ